MKLWPVAHFFSLTFGIREHTKHCSMSFLYSSTRKDMLQCFVCSPIPKVSEKKWATGRSFIRKEITTYRIGTLVDKKGNMGGGRLSKIADFETTYRISSYSFHGNYSFLDLEIQRSQYIKVRKLFKGANYSRAETIWGNTVSRLAAAIECNLSEEWSMEQTMITFINCCHSESISQTSCNKIWKKRVMNSKSVQSNYPFVFLTFHPNLLIFQKHY